MFISFLKSSLWGHINGYSYILKFLFIFWKLHVWMLYVLSSYHPYSISNSWTSFPIIIIAIPNPPNQPFFHIYIYMKPCKWQGSCTHEISTTWLSKQYLNNDNMYPHAMVSQGASQLDEKLWVINGCWEREN